MTNRALGVRRPAALALFVLLAAPGLAQDFEYLDFTSTSTLALVGGASQAGGSVLRVAAAAGNQVGAAYHAQPVRVARGFDTRFRFQLSAFSGGGADGLTFVVHADPRGLAALGSTGGEMGYGAAVGAPVGTAIANSLVVELDTWFSSAEGDLSDNTISVHTNGPWDNDNDELYSLAQVIPAANLSDGAVHELRVQVAGGLLNVYLDDLNNPLISTPYDVEAGGPWAGGGASQGLTLQPGGLAFVGFTAATGGAWEHHDVLSWSFSSNGGPGTVFCGGDGAGAVCPCGNFGAGGEGCANSTGAGAVLGSEGSESVAAADLRLVAAQVPPGRTCLFVQGDLQLGGGLGLLWGDGLRCTGTNTLYLGFAWSDAAGAVSGAPGVAAAGGAAAGQTRCYQLLYRDPPGPCSSGFNASNGLEVLFLP